jgi:hypothetical protein
MRQRAAAENKPLLSPVTQQQYLAALRDVLDLAAKKRLIPVNPAEGLKPIKRDTVAAGEKRRPFTLEQINQFFQSKFYSECAKHPLPSAHDTVLAAVDLSVHGDAAKRGRPDARG